LDSASVASAKKKSIEIIAQKTKESLQNRD
jgi:hypothetical protein